jgi:hypothetical protein
MRRCDPSIGNGLFSARFAATADGAAARSARKSFDDRP